MPDAAAVALPHRLQPLLRSHNMRWLDFLAAFIFIGVTALLLGGTAMSIRQRTPDIYMAKLSRARSSAVTLAALRLPPCEGLDIIPLA